VCEFQYKAHTINAEFQHACQTRLHAAADGVWESTQHTAER
jgi:hypothetical protein